MEDFKIKGTFVPPHPPSLPSTETLAGKEVFRLDQMIPVSTLNKGTYQFFGEEIQETIKDTLSTLQRFSDKHYGKVVMC